MTQLELFHIWAPPESPWSVWAKPVLFAHASPGQKTPLTPMEVALPFQPDSAVVIELPGASSVLAGLSLARRGYRPVPLFNCVPGVPCSIPWHEIIETLETGAEELRRLPLRPEAPPAFLLDSKRMKPASAPLPGTFDNRWIVFPQDFPSAGFLKAHGIARAILLQENSAFSPQDDLAHVLLRWGEGGLHLLTTWPKLQGSAQPLSVNKPSWFRSIFHRLVVMAGLRPNSAGGFGAIIPQPSSGGYG